MISPEKIFNEQYEGEWKELSKLEIDITNPTGIPQFINLFAYSLQDVVTQYPFLQFSDPESYNILVQDLEYSPIKAQKILFASTSQGQLANAATIKKKYADGKENIYTEFPIISVDTHQRQGNRVEVLFDELILDGFTSFSNYRINAGDTITILLYYRQLKRWCIIDFPDLFPSRKKITPKINKEISEKFCNREQEFREQDQDWKCKEGQKKFELSITNNSSSQRFINLFDNYSLTSALDLTAPINTVTTAVGNFSAFSFQEWVGNNLSYTIGGALNDTVVGYTETGSFVNEATIGVSANFALDNQRGKIYASVGTGVNVYDLGTGNAPTTILLGGGATRKIILDQTNGYMFVTRVGETNIVRIELDNYANITVIPTALTLNLVAGAYSPATNEIITQRSNEIIGINSLSGAITIRKTVAIGEIIFDIQYIQQWGGIVYTSFSAGVTSLVLISPIGTTIGTYTSLVVDWEKFTFDTTREELVLPEIAGTARTLFFTLDSLTAGNFSEFVSTGLANNVIGYRSSSQSILLGIFTTTSFQNLDRSSTIEFARPESYDYFTESLGEEPVKLSCLDIISSTQEQLVNNLVIQTKDADGHIKSIPKSPIVRVDTFQQAAGRSFIEMEEEVVLDGNTTFASYPLNAGETVTMVYYYHQFKRASFLSPDNVKRVKIQKPEPIIDYGEYDKIYNHEKHECEKLCKKIEIKVTNASGADSSFNFFQANQNTLIVNQLNATFDNVDEYNFIIQQLRDSPLVLYGVEVIGSDQNQLTEPIIVATIDADGNDFGYQHFPINHVDTNQRDGKRVFIKTNHLIIDGYTLFPFYNIKAGSSISFILYYRQFVRSDFLKTHIYPILRKPIVPNGSQVSNDIEYYNDISRKADNTWNFDGKSKKGDQNMHGKSEKSVIFGVEQVYSDGLNPNRSDFLVPFLKKSRVKFEEKRANCDIPKPDKQILYVNPNDLSFGKEKDFPVEDISDQGFNQFNKQLLNSKSTDADMIDLSTHEASNTYRKSKELFENNGKNSKLKSRIKPAS